MATTLNASMEFPAPAATVFAMFSEPTYLELKCAQSEQGTFEVSNGVSQRSICIERSFDEVPDSYRKFLGSDLILKEEQIWNLSVNQIFQADWKIVLEGKPVLLVGTLKLEDTSGGSMLILDAEVTVGIPFFGAMAEGFIREHFSKVLDDERAIGLHWLEKHK